MKYLILFLVCACVCIFYWEVAFFVFQFRNPKANQTTSISYIFDVLKFNKLERFQ